MTSPKIFILSSDAQGRTDQTVQKQILDFLPNKVSSDAQADVVLTVASHMPDYKFNHALLQVKRPLVLLDYCEFGWDWNDADSNLLGSGNLSKCSFLNTPEYAKLDSWAVQNPARLVFKREIRQSDVTPTRVPIDWLVYLPSKPLHTKDQFDSRAFEVFSCFGLSHPDRFRLHGTIFCKALESGISVFDSWGLEQHLDKQNTLKNEPNPVKRKRWVTIYSPYFTRVSIENIMRWQRRAKMSVSLAGCGEKCVRHAESCVDSIMALSYDNLAWSYPWTHGVNCIRLNRERLFDDLLAATQRSDLYEIYIKSSRTVELYRPKNYVASYVVPSIMSAI